MKESGLHFSVCAAEQVQFYPHSQFFRQAAVACGSMLAGIGNKSMSVIHRSEARRAAFLYPNDYSSDIGILHQIWSSSFVLFWAMREAEHYSAPQK
jgi:hypothetical protein